MASFRAFLTEGFARLRFQLLLERRRGKFAILARRIRYAAHEPRSHAASSGDYEIVGMSIAPRGETVASENSEIYLIARARVNMASDTSCRDVVFLRVTSMQRLGGHLQVLSREL